MCRNFLDGQSCVSTCSVDSYTIGSNISCLDCEQRCLLFPVQSYHIGIAENEPFILEVNASDIRQNISRPIMYSIEQLDNNNPFTIDPTTGVIQTEFGFDRESQSLHSFNVTASYPGSPISTQSASATVVVNVLDVNDNFPQFEQDAYTGYVLTFSPIGVTVLQVRAVDGDLGLNGLVSYHLQTDHVGFEINIDTGIITTTQIFFENESITVFVLAADSGSRSVGSSVAVAINVIDGNLISPVFSTYSANIPVNTPIGTTVLCAMATDMNSDDLISYSIIPLNDTIENILIVDSSLGCITTNAEISIEVGSFYEFIIVVIAMHNGVPSFADIVNLTVLVISSEYNNGKAKSHFVLI